MDEQDRAAAIARRLTQARAARRPIPRPDGLTPSMAHAVRARCIAQLTTDRSVAIGGYKVSLSTRTWGALPEDAILTGDASVPRASLIDPLLEGELAFLVEADLSPDSAIDDILAGCRVAPAIEVADSRWADWCPSDWDRFVLPTAEQIEADNAMSGLLVVGAPWVPARDLPLAALRVEMRSGGRVLADAPFRDVMGNPAEAVRWLIGQLARDGHAVRPGQILSAGCPHMTPVTVPAGGGTWEAVVEGLGTARLTFT